MKQIIGLLICGLLVASCSQSPVIPLSEKNSVIYDALYADALMNTWRYQCSEVSTRTHYAAREARAAWWQRNGEYIKSADFGLSYNIVTVTDDRIETGARLAMAMMWDIRTRSSKAVSDSLANKSNKETICLNTLEEYKKGKKDISANPQMSALLSDLKRYSQENQQDMDLRRAKISVNKTDQYGRSFYVAEKFAQDLGCSAPSVRLVKGEWPNEVYDLECTDRPFVLLRCEWGSCRAME